MLFRAKYVTKPVVLFRTALSRLTSYHQAVIWIIVGVVTAVALPVWWARCAYRAERGMGSVSVHWLAEYRQNHES
jgi:hypothetical protein